MNLFNKTCDGVVAKLQAMETELDVVYDYQAGVASKAAEEIEAATDRKNMAVAEQQRAVRIRDRLKEFLS